MDEALVVDILDSFKDLKSDHDDSFEGEGFSCLFKERLERVAERFHDHYAFFSFCEILIDLDVGSVTFRMPR